MKWISRITVILVVLLMQSCATPTPQRDSNYYMDLVIQWPMDAIRLNFLTTTPTETFGAKFRHLQAEIAKRSDDGSTLDITVPIELGAVIVEGWTCDQCTGLSVINATVRQALELMVDIYGGFSFEVTPGGVELHKQ